MPDLSSADSQDRSLHAALTEQQAALRSIRTRGTAVFVGGAIATAFLAGLVVLYSNIETWSVAALGCFAGIGVLEVVSLLLGAFGPAPAAVSSDSLEEVLRGRRRMAQAASVVVSLQVVLLVADLGLWLKAIP